MSYGVWNKRSEERLAGCRQHWSAPRIACAAPNGPPERNRLDTFRTSAFARQYGWLRGLFKVLFLYFYFAERPSKGELTIESIVVRPAMRGKGFGTRLLEAVFDFALAKGFGSVRLQVVDTNPDARRLYERMGFVATKTRRHPYLRRMMGFSAVTTMVKELS